MIWLLLVLACAPTQTSTIGERTVDDIEPIPGTSSNPTDSSSVLPPSDTAALTDTGATGATPTIDCTIEPAIGAVPAIAMYTEEDFDFGPSGMLVTPQNGNIVGLWRNGDQDVLAVNVGSQLSGLRVLPSGTDLLFGDQGTGTVELVNEAGVVRPVMTGLSNPRAVAVDSQGFYYVSENTPTGRVRMGHVDNQQSRIIAEGIAYPNGLALSPDEQQLYVAGGSWGLVNVIWVFDRTGDTFDGGRLLLELDSIVFALTTDACGFLYAVDVSFGDLYRIDPDDGSAKFLIKLPQGVMFSGMSFGNGVGGFLRDHLYVTSRFEILDVPVGIPGKLPVYPVPRGQ